jgi:hypothetical protein
MPVRSAKWGKIIGVNAFNDAVGLHFEGEDKPIYFQSSSAVMLTYTLGDKEHELPVNDRFLRAAIDVAKRGGVPRLDSQVH